MVSIVEAITENSNIAGDTPKVLVLMSAYNGEKYLNEQLDSILAQEGCIPDVLIRDDGSSDNTLFIIKEYEERYSDRVKVIKGNNKGVIKSFFILINQAAKEKYDYYALADQDDIWMPDKLKSAVNLLEKEEKNIPLLYASAVTPVDEEKNELPKGIHYKNIVPEFGNALVENMCTGCTCVFNNTLLELLSGKTPDFTVMHDFWLYLVTCTFGKVIYDKTSHILYRQHGRNTVGMSSTVFENYKRRIKNFRRHRGQLRKQASELRRLYGSEIVSGEKRQLLSDFINRKFSLVCNRNIYRQRKSDDVIMRLFLVLGWL